MEQLADGQRSVRCGSVLIRGLAPDREVGRVVLPVLVPHRVVVLGERRNEVRRLRKEDLRYGVMALCSYGPM